MPLSAALDERAGQELPAKGSRSALQLLATCGVEAKLAAAAAAASTPIVGMCFLSR